MAQIPQYQRSVAPSNTPYGYVRGDVPQDAFGINVSQSLINMGNSLMKTSDAFAELKKRYDTTKLEEYNNRLYEFDNKELDNKDTGYLYKIGKDAMGKSSDVMASYDKYVDKLMQEYGFKDNWAVRAKNIADSHRRDIDKKVQAHDKKQSDFWQDSVYQDSISNILNRASLDCNDEETLMKNYQTGKILTGNNLVNKGYGNNPEVISLQQKDYDNKFYSAALNGLIAQDSHYAAKAFFDKYKDKLNSDTQTKFLEIINNKEIQYNSRNLADEIFSKSEDENAAFNNLESMQDKLTIEEYDSTSQRLHQKYSRQKQLKQEAETNALNQFYTTALQKVKNGEVLSFDDITEDISSNISPEVELSLRNYISKNAAPEDDSQVWQHLYEMKVNNAQGFASEDLNKYRGFLSESEFRQFQKDQQNIQKGDYYTIIKDDNAIIDEALEALKLNKRKKEDTAYSEMRSLVRELEARRGRKITDLELQNLADSLGFKGENGVQLYKLYEKGMAEKTGFIKSVVNDFVYYQSKHNGELPSDSEKYKIVQKRLQQKAQENKSKNQTTVEKYTGNSLMLKKISSVTSKPNEQKVLTYFADNQVPEISQKLGLELKVTSRYRNQKGSHHSEGRACDISLSEHNADNKIKIYEEVLKLPTIDKIGCSDPLILSHFKNNSKIKDERNYDKQHGTNHVNHMHITLIDYNPQSNVQIAADKQSDTYSF